MWSPWGDVTHRTQGTYGTCSPDCTHIRPANVLYDMVCSCDVHAVLCTHIVHIFVLLLFCIIWFAAVMCMLCYVHILYTYSSC